MAYLKDEWQHDGKWSEYGGQEGGITCLCTLALLNAGESPDEQVYLKTALDRVRKLHPKTTYVISLQTMVLCRADQLDRDQDIIAANADWLQETQIKAGVADRKGGWSYGENAIGPRGTIQGDGSNSQFALLALYEAARAAEKHHLHIKIERETWELRPQLLDHQSTGQRRLGLLQDNGTDGQHDLCRHFVARDLQRHAP